MKNIFVSYKFSDRDVAHNVKGLLQKGGLQIKGNFKFVENDVSISGSNAIDEEIKSVMRSCSVALFIAGDNSHNSPWINREAELATSFGLDLLVMRLPNTYAGIPNDLKGRGVKEIRWNAQELAGEI